jgi:hypothetical protein
VAAFAGEDISIGAKSRCLHPDKPMMFAWSDCPRKGAKCEVPFESDLALSALACEELKGDRDVVMGAVKNHRYALMYASEGLKGDRDVVMRLSGTMVLHSSTHSRI